MQGTILIADDDRTIRTVLSQAFSRAGCKVRATSTVSTLWRWIEEGEGDIVISDVNFPDGDGLDLLPSIKKRRPDLPVIFISAQNTIMTALRTAELGAYDYLPKPFDLKILLTRVSNALKYRTKDNEDASNATPQEDLPLIGRSAPMQEIYRLIARVRNTDLNVMIVGESGTGKDLLARSLHKLGNRHGQAFIKIQTGSATQVQLQGILAGGYEDQGIMPAASNATIYLDDIAEMNAKTQIILLDLLRCETVKARNFRFIASSRVALDELLNDSLFRDDLFFRLNVISINLPPLRERREDIADLTAHFLTQAHLAGLPPKTILREGIERMRNAPWLGNLRELENFINRVVVLFPSTEINAAQIEQALNQSQGTHEHKAHHNSDALSGIIKAHLSQYFEHYEPDLPPDGLYQRILEEMELPLIALSLAATRGNQLKTAKLLGLNRNTLRKKIAALEIKVTRSKKLL